MNQGTVNVKTLRDMLERLCDDGMGHLPVMFMSRNEHGSIACNIHSDQLNGCTDDLILWLIGSQDKQMDERAGHLNFPFDKMPIIMWEKWINNLNCDGPVPEPEMWV